MEAARNVKRKHFLLLSVLYSGGTGFLSDDSGMMLYYTSKDMEHAGKMVVGHRHDNSRMIMPGVHAWTVSGLCSSHCFAGGVSARLNITGVSLHAGERAENARVRAGKTGYWETVVSGFRYDHQPVRQLNSPYEVDMEQEDVVVECELRDIMDGTTSGIDEVTVEKYDGMVEEGEALYLVIVPSLYYTP